MKKFIVIYHAPTSAIEETKDMNPEEMKKGMESWLEWGKKCGCGLVDLGAALGNGQILSKSGSSPSERDVTGYSILQTESMEEAIEMLKGHPHLEWADGCEIEVHEAFPMPISV